MAVAIGSSARNATGQSVGDQRIDRIEGVLLGQAQRRSSATALVEGQIHVTYQELVDRAMEFSGRLTDAGVSPGDRVVVFLERTADYVVALYGGWLAGAVVVPINEALVPAQVLHIMQDSGCKFLVTSATRLRRTKFPPVENVTVVDCEAPSDVGSVASPSLSGGGEPAAILYTSGSTGRPKGIVLSHHNLIAGSEIVTTYLGVTERDRLLSVLPFGFDYGLNQLLGAVYRGASLVLQRSTFPADICRTLVDDEVTGMAGVPPLWVQLAQQHSPFLKSEFPSLRFITNSGGRFPVPLIRDIRRTFPNLEIYLMYGLSEAFRSTYLPPKEIDDRPDSIGIAIPQTQIHVLDEELNECGPGVVGELVHRGPTVALGYWEAPEATEATFRSCPPITGDDEEKVVFSGDLVYRDDEGFLFFSGRRDQLIKSLGYRVSAEEIEEFLLTSDFIAEVAVTSEPDEERGAAIIAHVVPQDAAVEEKQLADHARRIMPTYMRPSRFVFHSHLPRTSSGKIDRRGL